MWNNWQSLIMPLELTNHNRLGFFRGRGSASIVSVLQETRKYALLTFCIKTEREINVILTLLAMTNSVVRVFLKHFKTQIVFSHV